MHGSAKALLLSGALVSLILFGGRPLWAERTCSATFCVTVIGNPSPPPSFPRWPGMPGIPETGNGRYCPESEDEDPCGNGAPDGGGSEVTEIFPNPFCTEMAAQPAGDAERMLVRAVQAARQRLDSLPACAWFLSRDVELEQDVLQTLLQGGHLDPRRFPPYHGIDPNGDPRHVLSSVRLVVVRPGDRDPEGLLRCDQPQGPWILAATPVADTYSTISFYPFFFSRARTDACRVMTVLHEIGHATQWDRHGLYNELQQRYERLISRLCEVDCTDL